MWADYLENMDPRLSQAYGPPPPLTGITLPFYIGSEILTATTMNSTVFWVVSHIIQTVRFGGSDRLHLQGSTVNQARNKHTQAASLPNDMALKPIRSSSAFPCSQQTACVDKPLYCYVVWVIIDRVMDWILDWLTTYTQDSELWAITEPPLISTIHKSPQYTLSVFQTTVSSPAVPGNDF
jgi:hypothetical protein